MTPEQVIALADRKARESGEKWAFGSYGGCYPAGIRCGSRCPLEVASNVTAGRWYDAQRDLGIDDDEAEHVKHAADFADTEYATLRALMLTTFDFGDDAGGRQ